MCPVKNVHHELCPQHIIHRNKIHILDYMQVKDDNRNRQINNQINTDPGKVVRRQYKLQNTKL